MKRRHFEALSPVCPLCRVNSGQDHALEIASVTQEQDDRVVEGWLVCTHGLCQYEYPIIDGIPILVPDARAYVNDYLLHVIARDDLSPQLQAMVGECCGPGSHYDSTRIHLSSYTWNHYGQFDTPPEVSSEHPPAPGQSPDSDSDLETVKTPKTVNRNLPGPEANQSELPGGGIAGVLERGLSLMGVTRPDGPVIDTGCAVGRATFELAQRCDGLVLGVDLNFAMLRAAARVMTHSEVCYARRKVGLIYEQRRFSVPFEDTGRVDFWACDATALPFGCDTFATVVSLNVLDSVASPLDHLRSISRVLRPQGRLVATCPYDWSSAVTVPEAWIGGHSPRSNGAGSSRAVLESLLTPGAHPAAIDGLRIVGQADDIPWQVRLHERSVTTYQLHMIAAQATGPG